MGTAPGAVVRATDGELQILAVGLERWKSSPNRDRNAERRTF